MKQKQWMAFFEEKMKKPEFFKILEVVDLGYNSVVYLVSVNGEEYAVKMYNQRFNDTNVCVKESDNITKFNFNFTPRVIFYSKHYENEFNREILVLEKMGGKPLNNKMFNDNLFKELTKILKKMHARNQQKQIWTDDGDKIHDCRSTIMQFLKNHEVIPQKRVLEHLDALENYYVENKELFKVQKRIVHGDLWWDNILVDNGKIKIIDWLEADQQDYCRDLTQLKIGTLDEILDTQKSEEYFLKLLNDYEKTFRDETIHERMRYYLPLMYLEESFYLPFKFFPWEIKYKEDPKSFEKRFIDYFEKSEKEFNNLFISNG